MSPTSVVDHAVARNRGSILANEARLNQYAERVLGPLDHLADRTRGGARVLEVRDRAGGHWIVKTVPRVMAYRRELSAYLHWVPQFADQAPRLHHAKRTLRTLILERAPGDADWTFLPERQREAGRLLRRIHDAAPARTDGPPVGDLNARTLAMLLRQQQHLLSRQEQDHVEHSLSVLREHFHHMPRVPCHGDFGGHNWLRDGDRLRVIDFGLARFDSPTVDFARLYIGPWWKRPHLAEAFFDGYGRSTTAEELDCIRLQLPVLAASLLAQGKRKQNRCMATRGRNRLAKLIAGQDFTQRLR